MIKTIPYTYFIKHKETGYFYYGVKYSKNADPNLFWVNYFTSSKSVKNLIELYGKDSFEVQIRKTFKDRIKAKQWEDKVISKIRNWDKCLNISVGGDAIKSHKNRHIKDKDGFTSYERAGKKISNTLKFNPIIVKNRVLKLKQTLKDNPDILRLKAIKIQGDKNPSKKEENKKKISEGVKKWANENPNKIKNKTAQMMITMNKPDENGLSLNNKHSIFMKENNPAFGTKWYNNGMTNLRCFPKDKPKDFVEGRLFKRGSKSYICEHCGKKGSGPNMKRYHFENCKELIKD